MKTLVVRTSQQHERRIVGKVTISLLAAALFALAGLVACNDKDADEQQSSASKAAAGQQTAAQKPAEKAEEGEEGEEGPATPAAVAAEKPAPQQTSGKQFACNFDGDTPGQLPAKFHGAKTGEVPKRSGR